MSLEKNRLEAERWCKTNEGDLDTAVILSQSIPSGVKTRFR